MNSTILKLFGTGQITLPKKWRTKFKTTHFKAVMEEDKLIITPLEEEEIFFDADEFNAGEGVELNEFYKALKKSLK
jgi:bifunctional DNA-binding transcriptional regulator/antitoxin component of YhaV-PrlF toxin-antitoxin module